MLKLKNVNTYYGDVQALFNVSLELNEGEIVSIVGSNGAGKSTILNTISNLLRCSDGTIYFCDTRINEIQSNEIVELGLIQVPEGRHNFSRMSVLENLELGSFPMRARKEKDKNLKIVFEMFPILNERKKQLSGTLSGGEQQMLAIAKALMSSPKLLMLDEPSLGLAPKLVQQVFSITEEIKKRGVTVLLVEQNTSHSLSISDRGYVLENGRVVLEGKGKELLNNDHVRKAYLGI